MDKVSEDRLSAVHPTLAAKVRAMAAQLEADGIIIRVTQGMRTYQEQDALYAQGRKPLVVVNARRVEANMPHITDEENRHVVTNAYGGTSYHNYGLAVDCVPGLRGVLPWAPNWDPHHSDYSAMIKAGEAQGLFPGARFHALPDYPHFQMNGVMPIGCPTPEAQQALRTKSVSAAWEVAGLPVPPENGNA